MFASNLIICYLILVGVFVNHTLTGDPLMTDRSVCSARRWLFLTLLWGSWCSKWILQPYHGRVHFSQCSLSTSCNPQPQYWSHVVTQIGVWAVGSSGACWNNIQVDFYFLWQNNTLIRDYYEEGGYSWSDKKCAKHTSVYMGVWRHAPQNTHILEYGVIRTIVE